MRIDRPQSPTRSLKWFHWIMGLLYLLVCGMVLYFRLGPFNRVMDRLESQGTEIPAWFSVVFTVGPTVVAVFLAWKGATNIRRALRGESRS